MVPCKSTAEEVSFEWTHHRILFTVSKVKTTPRLHNWLGTEYPRVPIIKFKKNPKFHFVKYWKTNDTMQNC